MDEQETPEEALNRVFRKNVEHSDEITVEQPTPSQREGVFAAAERIGTEHGRNAGSWVVDGNSSTETLKGIIQAAEDCDLDIPSPLSGEWADDYTIEQLVEDCGLTEAIEDLDEAVWVENELINAYLSGYYQAYEAEAMRSALAMLPEEEETQ